MIEQEVKVLVARLMRVWGPIKPVVIIPLAEGGQDEVDMWVVKADLLGGLKLEVYTSELGNAPSLRLWDETRRERVLLLAIDEDYEWEIREDPEVANRDDKLLAFFRRGCWLCGCDIKADDDEKEEWMGEFYQEELEEWGLKDVNDKVKWEASQVAAAFEVGEWQQRRWGGNYWKFISSGTGDDHVKCEISPYGELIYVSCGFQVSCTMDFYYHVFTPVNASLRNSSHVHYLMARGLYRLGITSEEIIRQLPPLSAHEKLELRLSMPREFWPQKWLDEGA